jgi:class 3 adenylate cyclase
VVYQVFGEALLDYYVRNLSELWRRLGGTAALGFHVLGCPLSSLPTHQNLVKSWKQRDRNIGEAIRDALLTGPLFAFGEPTSQSLPG